MEKIQTIQLKWAEDLNRYFLNTYKQVHEKVLSITNH